MATTSNQISFSPDLSEAIALSDEQLVTTSIAVARHFGKRHNDVIRKIESISCSDKFRCANFSAHLYSNEQNGETYTLWKMSKDGFMFLVMGFTGKKAAAIKEAYINAFNKMEANLDRPIVDADGTQLIPLRPTNLKSVLGYMEGIWERD